MAFGYRKLFISCLVHYGMVKIAYHYNISSFQVCVRERRNLQEIINHGRHYRLAFALLKKGDLQVLYIIAFIGI